MMAFHGEQVSFPLEESGSKAIEVNDLQGFLSASISVLEFTSRSRQDVLYGLELSESWQEVGSSEDLLYEGQLYLAVAVVFLIHWWVLKMGIMQPMKPDLMTS